MSAKTNTLLAAARLAYPDLEWYLQENGMVYHKAEDDGMGVREFSLNNPADAYALEGKLQDHGWMFFKVCDLWHGYHPEYKNEAFRDGHWVSENRENLLLICVETLEAMK